jgi:hypothetical protein
MAPIRAYVLRTTQKEERSDEALQELCRSARNRRLVLVLGAGVSREFPSLAPIARPSGLPGLIDLLREAVLEPLPPHLKHSASKLLPEMGLEQLLESVAGVAGDDALDFLNVLEPPASRPNYRHLAIARLAVAGRLRALTTVNFDTFLERAFEDFKVPYFVPEEASDEAGAYRRSPTLADRLPLFKLHGTLRNRASLITTIETVGLGLPRYKVAALRAVLEDSDIFFLGYSDNDVDVFREFEQADIRGRVFWHFLDPPDPGALHLARIVSFLSLYPHWAFSGSLDQIFEAILGDIDPTWSAELLAKLGYSSFADVEKAEEREIGTWSDDLRRRVASHTAAWLTPEVSALIIRRSLGESSPELVALRRELLELVEHASALNPRVEIARSNQVAEEMSHRGDVRAAIRLRRELLAKYQLEAGGPLRAQLMEEKVRLVSYELRSRGEVGRGLLRLLSAWRELRPGDAGLPERDRSRLRLMLAIRYPAALHKWGQAIFARELAARMRGRHGKVLARLLRGIRMVVMRASERRYRAIVENEFGAGFRGLAMQRVAELTLLIRGWVPEVDELLRGARWRTRPGWQGREQEDDFQYLSIAEGLRLFYLGNLPKARMNLCRTYKYYAARRDISGRTQSLLYLAAMHVELGEPGKARLLLRVVRRLKRSYR